MLAINRLGSVKNPLNDGGGHFGGDLRVHAVGDYRDSDR
jgi:hypothetical protein